MTVSRPRTLVISVVMLASMTGMALATVRGPLAATSDSQWALTWLGWPVAGWIVLIRRPGNRIGQLSMAIGAVMGLAFWLQSMVLDLDPAISAWVELTYTVLGIIPWMLIVAIINTFPSGTYAGRWEASLGRALVVFAIWALLGFTFSPEPLTDTGLNNPLAIPQLSALAAITSDSGFFLVVILGLASLIRLFIRAKRSTGIERQQFRWLLLGAGMFVLVSGAGQVLPENSAAELIWYLGGWAIPIAIGVAVIRYRLYDIDRIISRTVAYLVVIGLLGAVFFAGVTALSSVLPAESPLAVAGSTLGVAALFSPLRTRVQAFVNRHFDRTRYDATLVAERFANSLAGRVESDGLIDDLVGVVSETMQPHSVGVWVRESRRTRNDFGTPGT